MLGAIAPLSSRAVSVSIDFANRRFHPVVDLSAGYEVLDLSGGAAVERMTDSPFTIGRYDEDRSIYTSSLFAGGRSIHVGIDIGAPAGTPVYAFEEGELFLQGLNEAPGDYGPTVITHHLLDGVDLWVLHGHLSLASLGERVPGDRFAAGDRIGWIGEESINGGWPPHLHIQLSYRKPDTHDLPGAVSQKERTAALQLYPDPRLILGPLY